MRPPTNDETPTVGVSTTPSIERCREGRQADGEKESRL